MTKVWVFAGFGARLAAYLIDIALCTLVFWQLESQVLWVLMFSDGTMLEMPLIYNYTLLDILSYLGTVSYFVVMTRMSGRTLGKFVMNLNVVSKTGEPLTWFQVIYRETVGKFLSGLILSAGYLMVIVDKKKRGLHDRLSDTLVIYEKRLGTIKRVQHVTVSVPQPTRPVMPQSMQPVPPQSVRPVPPEVVQSRYIPLQSQKQGADEIEKEIEKEKEEVEHEERGF